MDNNPNPKSTMAFHFMQALATIQQQPPAGRSRRISRAAYASMAITTGPRRTWSQILLQRLRGRRMRGKRVIVIQRRARVSGRLEGLRRLVPGGRSMDMCNLLEETCSYVQCLRDQVKIMQTIVDSANCYKG